MINIELNSCADFNYPATQKFKAHVLAVPIKGIHLPLEVFIFDCFAILNQSSFDVAFLS